MTTRFPTVEYDGDLEHVGATVDETDTSEPNTRQSTTHTAD